MKGNCWASRGRVCQTGQSGTSLAAKLDADADTAADAGQGRECEREVQGKMLTVAGSRNGKSIKSMLARQPGKRSRGEKGSHGALVDCTCTQGSGSGCFPCITDGSSSSNLSGA